MAAFIPTPDTAAIIDHLFDIYERRDGQPKQAVRVRLDEMTLSGYYSQVDPTPRVTTNEQMAELAQRGWLSLAWEAGQSGHLLKSVTLNLAQTEPLYGLVERQPLAKQRQQLRDQLLAERRHLTGWRRKALEHCLNQLGDHKSPAPFGLTKAGWNRDLLTTLLALPDGESSTEIPYRMFSVRIFNDSKRFELLKDSVVRLARRHNSLWRDLSPSEVLREMGLVANPNHLYLHGPWQLTDFDGVVTSLADFYPAVGIPAAMAARTRRVDIDAGQVICVENLTAFYELVRQKGQGIAALCLWGNPSPAVRHLLRCVAHAPPDSVALQLWADIDYGGLNILAHLRRQVSARFIPFRMDIATLRAYRNWAQPLSRNDERNLARLRQQEVLSDMVHLIDYMLLESIKLEQEAVGFGEQ
jgi:hypothetical protein